MGQGHTGVGGRRTGAGHAGHHLELHTGRGERRALFAAATEHERVAALQAHDDRVVLPAVDEQRVDVVLGDRRVPGRFTDVDAFRARGRHVQERRGRQPVVDDDLGAFEQFFAPHRDEAGVARARADEKDGHDLIERATDAPTAAGSVPLPCHHNSSA